MKIVVDCFGGDKSPGANVQGAIDALSRYDDLHLVLTGDEAQIKEELSELSYDKDRIEIVHAPEIITGDDKPVNAIRQKKESSMVKAFKIMREDEDVKAVVSTGATVLLGYGDAEDAEFRHLVDRFLGETLLFVDLGGQRFDLLLGKLADHLAEQFLRFVEIEIHSLRNRFFD